MDAIAGLCGDGEGEGAVQGRVETMGAASDREGSLQDEGSDEAGRWRVLFLGKAVRAGAHQQTPGPSTPPACPNRLTPAPPTQIRQTRQTPVSSSETLPARTVLRVLLC